MYYKTATYKPVKKFTEAKPRLSKIGKIFIIILLIVVLEGAVRKWMTSAFTVPLVLTRDILALYGIYWALKTRSLRFANSGAKLLAFWTYLLLGWGLVQLLINQNSPLIFVVGIRFWLLYLWFSYAAAVSVTEYDFNLICKTIVALLLAMTPLAVIQHFLPPDAFLNKQVDSEEGNVFLVAAGIVRTTGTFSFTTGFATMLEFTAPFVLCLLAPGTKLWNRKWMPMFCFIALGIATTVSGSRGAIIFFGFMFTAYVIVAQLYSKRGNRFKTMSRLFAVISLIVLVSSLFSTASNANKERFKTASESESLAGRLIFSFIGENDFLKKSSLVGSGIGVGTNFAGAVVTGERDFLLSETDTGRTILEGGLLGFAFIGLKILIISIGLRRSWLYLKSSSETLPFLLWVATTPALLTWSIMGQLTVNALGYMLLGLAIASLRFFRRRV